MQQQNPSRWHRWLRFVIGGAINTAATYAVYLALYKTLGYQVAYAVAYILGVVFAYWFNAVVVFKAALSWRGLFSYPLVYVVQYGVSALLLSLLVEQIGFSTTYSPLAVTLIMVPGTYFMNKMILIGRVGRC